MSPLEVAIDRSLYEPIGRFVVNFSALEGMVDFTLVPISGESG